jgi:hypothetical protein
VRNRLHENRISWTYDLLGRVTDEVFDHYEDMVDKTADSLDQTEHYLYDLVGNRLGLALTHDGKGSKHGLTEVTQSDYDANDRLLTDSKDTDGDADIEEVVNYGYDHTQQTSKDVRQGETIVSSTAYAYDLQGRLHSVETTSSSGVETSVYEYDTNGIRTAATETVDSDLDGIAESVKRTEYLNDPQNETGYSQVIAESEKDLLATDPAATRFGISDSRTRTSGRACCRFPHWSIAIARCIGKTPSSSPSISLSASWTARGS